MLATRVADLLTGTAELTVAGALPARTAQAREADGTLTRIASRAATATALGDGLTALVSGLTVTAAALVGAQAVVAGRLDGVTMAVVVLTPLAAFEAVTRAAARRAVPAAGAPERRAGVRGAGRPGARAGAGAATPGARVAVPGRRQGAGRPARRGRTGTRSPAST